MHLVERWASHFEKNWYRKSINTIKLLCYFKKNELLFILDNQNFANEFSNGFLIGEILAKYDLCDDFSEYSQSR